LAQVEWRELPLLQGGIPLRVYEGPATPSAPPTGSWSPGPRPPAPTLPQTAGAAQGEGALPPEFCRALNGRALTRPLAQVPIPSASLALASLLARALATNPEGAGSETSVRVAVRPQSCPRQWIGCGALDAEARRLAFEALYAYWPSHGKG